MKKLVTLTALIVAIAAVAIGAASFRGPWVMPDTDEVSEYVPNVVDLYLPSNPTTGYSWTYVIEDPSIVSLRDEYFSQSMGSDLVGAGDVASTSRRQNRQPTGSASMTSLMS